MKNRYRPKRAKRYSKKKSTSKGDSLESYLDQTHGIMLTKGLGRVKKIPSPVRITGSNGNKVTGRKLVSQWADYAGTLAGGLSVVFEAKASGEGDDRFYFGRLESKSKGDDQIEILAEHARLGAVAFVYVRHHKDPIRFEDYVLPVAPDQTVAGVENDSDIHGSRGIRFEDIPDLLRVPKLGDWSDVIATIFDAWIAAGGPKDTRKFFEEVSPDAAALFLENIPAPKS